MAGVASVFVAVPCALGSLVARVARRPWWVAYACGAAAFLSLTLRGYLVAAEGGVHSLVLTGPLTAPNSALLAAGWAASLWHSAVQAGGFGADHAPSLKTTGAVTLSVLLGAGICSRLRAS